MKTIAQVAPVRRKAKAVQRLAGRKLPTGSLAEWKRNKPQPWIVQRAMDALVAALPEQWKQPMLVTGLGKLQGDGPVWAQAWDAMQAIAEFDQKFGRASSWNLDDAEICAMAKRMVDQVDELDAGLQAKGMDVAARVDAVRLLLRMLGVQEAKPLVGEADIRRAADPAWWRRLLRRHVARVVEAGAVRLGVVNRKNGGYASHETVRRREQQIRRNAEAMKKSLFRNEAGQVFTLAELAALSPSNPIIRGGELMTRIRGAEEYADARNHVGLFLTLTLPSRFHAITLGSGGRPRPNPKYDGHSTPRNGQMWLREMWARVRAKLKRDDVPMYGIRVAEPHHDATPHWHALVWAECEEDAQHIEAVIRAYWLSDDGEERGAQSNRVNIKRMQGGGAAGYVAKYIAKSVGHAALADHLDVVQGQLWDVEQGDLPGHRRVDAWAACWGIRQFQAIGMPSVCVWRELRRVGQDQVDSLHRDGDVATRRAWLACHREGEILANWRVFMEAMGGHCLARGKWHLRVAHRPVREAQVNQYGEVVRSGRVVGLCTRRGQWLISRRIAWAAVAGDEAGTDAVQVNVLGAGAAGCSGAEGAARGALPRAWTGFNNCTARLTGQLRKALIGGSARELADWQPPQPAVSAYEKLHTRLFGLSPEAVF